MSDRPEPELRRPAGAGGPADRCAGRIRVRDGIPPRRQAELGRESLRCTAGLAGACPFIGIQSPNGPFDPIQRPAEPGGPSAAPRPDATSRGGRAAVVSQRSGGGTASAEACNGRSERWPALVCATLRVLRSCRRRPGVSADRPAVNMPSLHADPKSCRRACSLLVPRSGSRSSLTRCRGSPPASESATPSPL